MGLFGSQPLTIICHDMEEIRAFLLTCRYVSDHEQFGLRDHWMPPVQFEQTRRGDCDDFALWTWRQLLSLGYDARFVGGIAGRYGAGHAWVTFRADDQIFILEPLLARYRKFPRLETLRYRPAVSVTFSGSHVKFFDHSQREKEPSFRVVAPLVLEWLQFFLLFWFRTLPRLLVRPLLAGRRSRQMYK